MTKDRTLRMRDVAAYLGVTHQRVTQMHAEGKLPEPDRVDGIGPLWKPATIDRWAEREWWGYAALEAAPLGEPGGLVGGSAQGSRCMKRHPPSPLSACACP